MKPFNLLQARLLLGLLAVGAVACGGSFYSPNPSGPDPYLGVADPSGFDTKFQAMTAKSVSSGTLKYPLCPSGACYPVQQGFAHGQPIYFYNLGAITTSFAPTCGSLPAPAYCKDSNGALQLTPQMVTTWAYTFPSLSCKSIPFDAFGDAYHQDEQYTILNQFPLAVSIFANPVIPIAAVAPGGNPSETCNDLKFSESITSGKFGATPGANADGGSFTSNNYELWGAIDMTAQISPLLGADGGVLAQQPLQFAWAEGLQSAVLSGGPVPLDSNGNLLIMDGVIVDQTGGFSKITDPKTVILPFAPGEAGYSPIVHLHDYSLQFGENIGDYTQLCGGNTGVTCGVAPPMLDMARTSASTFNTIFIVAAGQ